jgi:hypothetical protein
MASYKITLWVETDQDQDFIANEIEQMELYGIQYAIDEVLSA